MSASNPYFISVCGGMGSSGAYVVRCSAMARVVERNSTSVESRTTRTYQELSPTFIFFMPRSILRTDLPFN